MQKRQFKILEKLDLQQKRLLKLGVIALVVLHFSSMTYIAFGTEYEVFAMYKPALCKKSVTVKGNGFAVLNFYVPAGLKGITVEFKVSEGTIKHWISLSKVFDSNLDNYIQHMEEKNYPLEWMFQNGEKKVFGWCDITEEYRETQKWDVFLYNEDSYDKEVQITVVEFTSKLVI